MSADVCGIIPGALLPARELDPPPDYSMKYYHYLMGFNDKETLQKPRYKFLPGIFITLNDLMGSNESKI